MANGDIVASGEVTVSYQIVEHEVDGCAVYDYYGSDEWFLSIEEAVLSFKDSVGGN